MNINNLPIQFPMRIRTESQIAQIDVWYNVAKQMLEVLKPSQQLIIDCIAAWEAMGTDDAIAMAIAYQEAVEDYDNDDAIIHQYFQALCQCEECTQNPE